MCREQGGRILHIDVEGKKGNMYKSTALTCTSSSLSRRALASLCFSEMKEEQNALSPMGIPRLMILVGLGSFHFCWTLCVLKISHFGIHNETKTIGPWFFL